MSVHLTGHMGVTPDRMDAAYPLLDHIALTRAEMGCLSFQITPCSNVRLDKLSTAKLEREK